MNRKVTIKHPELVAIDGADGKIWFGGKIDWFPASTGRRFRGGAVVAAGILSYLAATRDSLWDLYPPGTRRTQAEFEKLVAGIWEYLMPEGVEQLGLNAFVNGLNAYVEHAGHPLFFNAVDIAKDRNERPSADRCLGFIDDAMERDTPVAFLTRKRGENEGEYIYTWALLVGRRGNMVILAEDGVQKNLDFRLWYDTTEMGGALVFIVKKPLS